MPIKKQKIAEIIDKQNVWKNLKELNGESFLFKLKPKFMKCEYVIENNYRGEYTILCADKNGKVKYWLALSKQPIENEGYEITG